MTLMPEFRIEFPMKLIVEAPRKEIRELFEWFKAFDDQVIGVSYRSPNRDCWVIRGTAPTEVITVLQTFAMGKRETALQMIRGEFNA